MGLALDEGLDDGQIVRLQGRQSYKVAPVSVLNILQGKTLVNKMIDLYLFIMMDMFIKPTLNMCRREPK